MRQNHKLLFILGLTVMLLLAACGGGETPTPTLEPTDIPPTATTEPTEEAAATDEATDEAVMTEEATEEAVMTEEATDEALVASDATEEATEIVMAATEVPPTEAPTATEVPPTETPEPTEVPPTETPEPTEVPPTEVPPTETPEPTAVPPTNTPEPTEAPTEVMTEEATEEMVPEMTAEATAEPTEEATEEPTPEAPTQSITQLAINNNDLSIFMAAVVRAGMLNQLNGAGPFTVLAPTNEAFRKLPGGLLDTIMDNDAALANLLRYHVAEGTYSAEDVMGMETVMMLNGAEITVRVEDGEVTLISNNGRTMAKLVITDIQAANGVIHVIDTVLFPQPGTGNAGS